MNSNIKQIKPTTYFIISMCIATKEHLYEEESGFDIFTFLLRYSFLLNDTSKPQNSRVQKTPQLNVPQGNIYMGARYLDPKYSRWISVDPALAEYIPGAGKSDEADKLPGMGGVFNSVNLSLFHYAGNNPVRYVDPDGRSISIKRWIQRNWDNLISLNINIAEIFSGAGIVSSTLISGLGTFMGGMMITQGSLNFIACVGKIIVTTIAADLYGEDYADMLDASMPDSAIGFVSYGIGFLAEILAGSQSNHSFAESAGAIGDLLDIVCGIGISVTS